MDGALLARVEGSVADFVKWLEKYGETSYDHQSFFAGTVGRAAKGLYYRQRLLGTLAVSPMIFCEAFVPAARRLFHKPMRFPIADAHYASGFAFLARNGGGEAAYRRAVHFLDMLVQTRSPGYAEYGWGYPFDWVTMKGTIKEATPFITTLPYVYEAFEQVYRLDRDDKWLRVMRSIAEHARVDYLDSETSATASSCSYSPMGRDLIGVINASAYRSYLLIKAACDLNEPAYRAVGERNLNFVLENQNADGSWYYSADGTRHFVDHFHTCFVMKALAKIEALTRLDKCRSALERGVDYYVRHLVDADRLPKPFSRAPRLTVYKRELYDYAESINLAVLLSDRFSALEQVLSATVADVLKRWRKPDGSFRSRELYLGWDNVPMHRWAQSQLFRSFCFLLDRQGSRPLMTGEA